jgi:hypothetical protein
MLISDGLPQAGHAPVRLSLMVSQLTQKTALRSGTRLSVCRRECKEPPPGPQVSEQSGFPKPGADCPRKFMQGKGRVGS